MHQWVKAKAARSGIALQNGARVLDFGCGWGRMLHFLTKDVGRSGAFGVDVDATLVGLCHRLSVPAEVRLIKPLAELPFTNGQFDLVYSYSVFTHLPENVHLHSIAEIHRVLWPGGILACSIQPGRFIDAIAAFRPR
jgi:cyclopropane fatty-acyl-phospholipid synthase-like methyltransferase